MRCRTFVWLALVCLSVAAPPARAAKVSESPEGVAVPVESNCDDGNCGGDNEKLFRFISHSDSCFSDFISPMTNPVYFEDPRNISEARLIFINHKLPPALGGGDVKLIACQLRAVLTDRLSLVASKDGFVMADANSPHGDGWADLALGLKYSLYADPDCQRLLSAGFHYELPTGTPRALQGNGDGIFHMYLTGGTEFGNDNHLLSAMGLRVPANPHENSQSAYWSTHVDHHFACTNLYGLMEINWNHWLNNGDNTALAGVEGLDLYNFGSTNVAGNDIVTGAVGVKYKPCEHRELGVAWEVPLTQRRDILDNRITVDLILRY